MATEQERAALSKKRGQAASYISDPDERQKFVARQGKEEGGKNPDYAGMDREADDTIATQGANKAVSGGMPKYHSGTAYVPKTGPAILEKGEAVIPKEKNFMNAKKAMEGIVGKKKPAKKIKEIRTRKTDDGKYVHTHLHHHPEHHADETHVSEDLKGAQAHLAEQEPNMAAQPPEMPEQGQEGGPAMAPPMAAPGM